jgi:hypothetical protein
MFIQTDKFLQMDLLSKRALYACKDSFVTLEHVPDWNEYVERNQLVNPISNENRIFCFI